MRRWLWIAILLVPLAWGATRVWDHFHPEREYQEISHEISPSGRWRAEQRLVWVQLGFSAVEWVEVHLIDEHLKKTVAIVLAGSQNLRALNWEDNETLRITARNSIYIGTRLRNVGDIKIQLDFEPDDPQARRESLIAQKTPKENWWMYDIPPD